MSQLHSVSRTFQRTATSSYAAQQDNPTTFALPTHPTQSRQGGLVSGPPNHKALPFSLPTSASRKRPSGSTRSHHRNSALKLPTKRAVPPPSRLNPRSQGGLPFHPQSEGLPRAVQTMLYERNEPPKAVIQITNLPVKTLRAAGAGLPELTPHVPRTAKTT